MGSESAVVFESGQVIEELQFACGMQGFEALQKQAPEQA